MPVPDVKTARKEEKQSGNNTGYIARTLEDFKGPVLQKTALTKILHKITKLSAQNL